MVRCQAELFLICLPVICVQIALTMCTAKDKGGDNHIPKKGGTEGNGCQARSAPCPNLDRVLGFLTSKHHYFEDVLITKKNKTKVR